MTVAGNAEAIVARLGVQAGGFSFVCAVDVLQEAFGGTRPVGTIGPVEQETILFRAGATLGFPAADIREVAARPAADGPAWPVEMKVTFLGLYGPSSPMPAFWTETILGDADEARNPRDFLDLFDHPMIALVHRISRHYRIHMRFDRALEGPAPRALMALMGQIGGKTLAKTLDWTRLLPFAGLFAHFTRSRDTVVRIVAGYFDIPVAVEEWVARKVPIPPDQQFTLGNPEALLGSGTVLGESVPDVAGAVALVLGPLPLPVFEDFLPDGTKRRELRALLTMILREPLACFVDLVLDAGEASGLVLGGARLGWTTWQTGGDGEMRCPTGLI